MVYVLPLTSDRHAMLAKLPAQFTEPIASGAMRKDEMVLIKAGEAITHVATGSSKKKVMTLTQVRALPRPIQLLELPAIIPRRLITHAVRVFKSGGRLPPKTAESILESLKRLMSHFEL
jgi:hypothetical protein